MQGYNSYLHNGLGKLNILHMTDFYFLVKL